MQPYLSGYYEATHDVMKNSDLMEWHYVREVETYQTGVEYTSVFYTTE